MANVSFFRHVCGPATVLVGLLAVSAFPQDMGGGMKSSHRKAPQSGGAAPITRDEVRKTVDRVEKAVRKVLPQLPSMSPSQIAGAQPATKDAVILQLDRLFQLGKPAFRMTPQKVQFDSKTLKAKDAAAKRALENLVAWGFLPRSGVIATSPKDTLALEEFGDSVGFFLSRLAELTHTPNSRFSSYMQRDDD